MAVRAKQRPDLELLVRSREGVIFADVVDSVTSRNSKGVFDILPGHANFITLLNDILIIRPKGSKRDAQHRIKVSNGILRNLNNRIEVYIGVK